MFSKNLLIISILKQSLILVAIHLKTKLLLYALNITLLPPLTKLSACFAKLLKVAVLTLVACGRCGCIVVIVAGTAAALTCVC